MELSMSLLRGLLAYARDHQIEPSLLLKEAGLDERQLEPDREMVDMDVLGQAILALGRRGRNHPLGLDVGNTVPLQSLSVLGELVLRSATLRAALTESAQYLPLILPMSRLRLLEEGERAHLIFESPLTEPERGRFAVEMALAVVIRISRHYLGATTAPVEVRLRHASPHRAEAYAALFQCPVRFESARNEIIFPRQALDTRQPFPDEALWRLLKRRADDMLVQERAREMLHERVRHVLRHEVDLGRVDPTSIARRLGVSPRSLRRRLGDEGHSLSALADEVRRELSLSELLNPDMPIKHIADRVGFSEVSAFHRAFKRWTGVTPARYRSRTGLAHAS
ncbi:MAG: transcriptional regulator, AraC family [Pseudomonadota bacterium]